MTNAGHASPLGVALAPNVARSDKGNNTAAACAVKSLCGDLQKEFDVKTVLGCIFWIALLLVGGPLLVLGVWLGALVLGCLIGALAALFGGVGS